MTNYTNSDYALNIYSKGIVYKFADEIVEYTLDDYLSEHPDKTETDFRALKEISDDIYLKQVQAENAQTKNNTSLDEAGETMLCCAPSAEELLISEITAQEESERHERLMELADRALDSLTDVQRRRYLLHKDEGLTMRQIAEIEGVLHSKIQKSINAAKKKIKLFSAKI